MCGEDQQGDAAAWDPPLNECSAVPVVVSAAGCVSAAVSMPNTGGCPNLWRDPLSCLLWGCYCMIAKHSCLAKLGCLSALLNKALLNWGCRQ